MSAIRAKNTAPEIEVRRLLWGMGYRYRLHVKGLPGEPDIVFHRRRKIIEIRGCFWHRHPGCPRAAVPKTRRAFWTAKFASTIDRDFRNMAALEESGWKVMVLWECEVKQSGLSDRLRQFLM
jgi:DNA mismatch endonuclease Vsr